MKHDYTFEQAIELGKYFQALLRTWVPESHTVTLSIWHDRAGSGPDGEGKILRYDVGIQIDEAWGLIDKAWKAGLRVLPGTEQDFFVVDYFYHLPDDRREIFMFTLQQYSGLAPVLT